MIRHKPQRHRFSHSGLTLVDVTVTILIMGILASAAAPRFSGMLDHHRCEGAAQRVASDLEMAQQFARRSGIAQTVTFDPITNSYSCATLPDPNHPSQSYIVLPAQTGYAATLVSADFAGDVSVTFNMHGHPLSGSGPAPLISNGMIVVSSGIETRAIRVDAVTGKANVL